VARSLGSAAEQPGDDHPLHLRDHARRNRLARQQARTAWAAALLRWIHVVVTRQVTWDPVIAAGGTSSLGKAT
jgi:hypothetical protein